MLQFGNYGLHFVNTILFWMRVTANTRFAFDVEKQKIIFDYCSKGLRWTVYKAAMDVTAVGRQIRNNYTLKRGVTLNADFNLLKCFDNSDSCKYYLDGFGNKNSACVLHGNKGFWRSDYMSYLSGQNYMMSVKMNGPFVNKVESINTENLKGSFLNDGVCLIRRTGKEYQNIEALWNWDMLPGITCDTSFDPAATAIFHTKNNSQFVGQVSDGVTGISSMCYNRLGITAFKSYFFIADMHIALGAGISSKNKSNLVTTVNQCFYRQ
jgi:chondroitin AC lyase